MIKALILFNFLCISFLSFGQKEANVWYFGDYFGLDFNTNEPLPLNNSQMNSFSGSAVISDRVSGELLFYSNGENVWNRSHQIMNNGSGIIGSSDNAGIFIVPAPLKENIYYLFTTSDFVGNNYNSNIYYSMIDMNLGNGLGGVIPNEKNLMLADSMTKKITAVLHQNEIDYWIITHKINTNEFYVYLLTTEGISDPSIYSIGSVHSTESAIPGEVLYETNGYIKASPDGRKIASAVLSRERPFELFDFDASTGTISNPVNLGNLSYQYGVSFSPDNSKLYVSGFSIEGNDSFRGLIQQYDLNAQDIASSRVSLMDGNPFFDNARIYNTTAIALQIAPDGKVYGTGNPSSLEEIKMIEGGSIINNMFVIEKPNKKGFESGLKIISFSFFNQGNSVGLPSFVQNIFNNITPEENFNSPCLESKDILVFPNPSDNFFQISIAKRCFEPYNLTIYNVVGQVLQELRIDNALSQKIDVGSIAAGVYILSIQLPDQKLSKKFIKQ
jgi:hypothetical protein